jgi:hypothetical protein
MKNPEKTGIWEMSGKTGRPQWNKEPRVKEATTSE